MGQVFFFHKKMKIHLRKVQDISYRFLKNRPLFNHITITKATANFVEAEFKVKEEHLNINKHLFGGFIACLIDIGGSLAIIASSNKKDDEYVGVSSDMNISFLSSAKKDDLIEIRSTCQKLGRNLAFTKVDLYVGDRQIAFGSHTKFMGRNNERNE